MNPATQATTGRSRDRAVDRIRDLTLGTAIIGFAATGAFGVLAAVTYAGTTTTDAGTVSNDLPIPLGGGGDDSGTTSNSAVTTPAPFQAVQAPTRPSTHHAHVTSGGSGG